LLTLPHSGWPTIFKLPCWVSGLNSSTLERQRARAHRIGETKEIETDVGFGAYRDDENVVMRVALVLELVVSGVDHHRRHPVREHLVCASGFAFMCVRPAWRG